MGVALKSFLALILIQSWSFAVAPNQFSATQSGCMNGIDQSEIDKIEMAIDDALKVVEKVAPKECRHYGKFLYNGVPKNALKQALMYFQNNKSKFKNQKYISIADYSQNSKNKRFFLLNMETGEVELKKVSHGSGKVGKIRFADATIKNGKVTTNSNHNGMMKRCRIPEQYTTKKVHSQWALTRPGFFKTGEFYMSQSHDEKVKGRSGWPTFNVGGRSYNGMKLDGLVSGVNDKSRAQGVVMHEAYYNEGSVMGRSYGCPAFVPKQGRALMEKITGGSLYYSYVPITDCEKDHNKVLKEVKGWQSMCEASSPF